MKPEHLLHLLTIQMLVRLRHWQTNSYAEHKALGMFYEALDAMLDKMVEAWQGRTESRVVLPVPAMLSLNNYADGTSSELVASLAEFLRGEFADGIPSEFLALRDELLEVVEKTQYLLTLT